MTGTDVNSEALATDGDETHDLRGSFDWAKTPLGAIEGWPENLKAAAASVLQAHAAKASERIAPTEQSVAALRESESRLKFLDALGRATAGSRDADDILALTTRLVGEHLSISNCAYADMDADEDGFTIRGDWARQGSPNILGHYSLADFGRLAVKNLSAGQPLIINDNLAEIEPEEAEAFQAIGIAATICMPLVKNGRLTALMAIHDSKPHVWSENELALIREVTERSWAHVERVGIEANLRRTADALGEVNDNLEFRIGEQARSEEALRLSEQRFRAAINAVQGILWTNNAVGEMEGEQPGWAALTGQSEADYAGYGWASAVHPDDAEATIAAWNVAVADRRTFIFEHRVRRHDGEWRRFSIRAVPVLDATGAIREWVGVHTDVTDQRAAEDELQRLNADLAGRVMEAISEREAALGLLHQMQKMETIGQLTGGVAHDFNNLLTPIVGALDLLHRRHRDDARSNRMISGAMQSAERARVLVTRLLAFARRQTLQPVPVDVQLLIEGMRDLIDRSLGHRIELSIRVAPDIPAAFADPNQLELALLNLCVNAVDAMPSGGRLNVEAGRHTVSAAGEPDLEPGDYVRISVADTGIGMSAETLSRAVEPFYTTKDVGHGTGLGLSMVHGLALQLGGTLKLTSAPDQGTTATIILPATATVPASTPVQLVSPDLPQSRPLSILLVDDEELVRRITREMLTSMGHEVVEAASGAAALDHLSAQTPFDVLLTDFMMPSMTGVDLVRQARERRPQLPAVLITGFANLTDEQSAQLPRLAKPFSASELGAIVMNAAEGLA